MWLMKKIAQIKEYYRLSKEYKIKDAEFKQFLEDNRNVGDIYAEHQSSQAVVCIGPHKEFFGGYNYPCIVKKLARARYNVLPGVDIDGVFYCPNYEEGKPCEKIDCMWNKANHEYLVKNKKQEEFFSKLGQIAVARDTAKKRILGYIR